MGGPSGDAPEALWCASQLDEKHPHQRKPWYRLPTSFATRRGPSSLDGGGQCEAHHASSSGAQGNRGAATVAVAARPTIALSMQRFRGQLSRHMQPNIKTKKFGPSRG